ncbi:MAG: TldD/PmbA family protein [Bacteroidota bacterium]
MSLPLSFEDATAEVLAQSKLLLHIVQGPGVKYSDLFFEDAVLGAVHAEIQRPAQVTPIHRSVNTATTGVAIRAFDNKQHHVIPVAGWQPAAWTDAAGALKQKFPRNTRSQVDLAVATEINTGNVPPQDAAHAVSAEARQHVLNGMLDMLRGATDVQRARATLQYQHRRALTINTEGQALEQQRAAFGVRLDVWEMSGWHAWGQAGYETAFGELAFEGGAKLVQEVIARSNRLAKARPVKEGRWPVVFAGGWPGVWLHETAGHMLEADVLPTRLSPGDMIGPAALTVFDDPGLPEQRGTYAFDDEGNRGKRTMLIEAGKMVGVLNDRFFASRRGEALTGHGRRMHYMHLPAPRMSNLCLAAGPATPEALIQDVDEGLYVLQAGAGRIDVATDSVTLEVHDGYWIEKGRLTHPVSGVQITASRFDVLKNISGIANDVTKDHGTGVCEKAGQQVSVSMQTPTVLIRALQLVQQ